MKTLDDVIQDQAPEPEPLTPASPRELKRLMKDWRAGRATKSLSEAFHDAYVVLIAALMIGAMIVNVILKAQRVVSQCDSISCVSARAVLPWAAFAAAVAAALAVSRLFGPVLASAAEGFWLLDAPIQRARMLGARLVAAIVTALIGGTVVGAVVAALTGSGLTSTLVWAGATGLSAAAAVAFAASQQGIERHRLTHVATYVFSLLGLAALVLVVGISAGWFRLGLSNDLGVELGLVLVGFSTLVLVTSAVIAARRLSRIRRARLISGGSLVSGISGAFFALDIGLARDIVVERRAVEIGHVKPRRGRGVGLQAIIWRELQRLFRFPQPLLVVLGTIVVPYAADALGMSSLTPVFAGLALFLALIPMLGGLRVLTRTGGLARCLPFSVASIKLASIAVPAGVAAIWAIATTAAYLGFGDGAVQRSPAEASLMAIATALAGLLGAVRWTQAKGVDFGAPMISTQAGAFPPGLMTNLFRGFDVCLLITAPMLLGLSPVWSLVIAGIAALILLNSMDAESLRLKQAEQQKALEAQRKQRDAAAQAAKQRKR
ncbi:MAG: hypothetical protein AVDCRST_MAG75-588 [uncultured Propionibacteriaceae bacterium]|uniref:Uncharacterized protein n=1 Tax=uncultured Propionibacteriaceae bacterium TaxID=257457 RepID=A0A6J4N7T6_9ACTN|nr:MAG: hypothetical protein AVDCRST_MAG75-588 [uncultured Propionibacteriaceae bacterium]